MNGNKRSAYAQSNVINSIRPNASHLGIFVRKPSGAQLISEKPLIAF